MHGRTDKYKLPDERQVAARQTGEVVSMLTYRLLQGKGGATTGAKTSASSTLPSM